MIQVDITKHRNWSERGAALIAMALFFAAVGVLFGLGRLAAYRYQVERRINRQYQVDKMLATRSCLSFVKYAAESDITESYRQFRAYTNRFVIQQSNQELLCCLEPTPLKECLEMDNSAGNRFADVWDVYMSTPDNMYVVPVQSPGPNGLDLNAVKFGVKNAQSNEIYRCAIFKEMDYSWLDNQFGYMYRIEPLSGGIADGFGELNLYIVGAGRNGEYRNISAENYISRLSEAPYIKMRISLVGARDDQARRSLIITNSTGKLSLNDFWITSNDDSDDPFPDSEYMQASGLLLSGTSMVCFKENAMDDLMFQNRNYDLNDYIYTNDFMRSTLVIEHVFQTNMLGKLNVTVNSLIVKEPSTYAISVYNSNLGNDPACMEKGIMTWIFQTQYPNAAAGRQGRQCVLDTFGREASSLKEERKGGWAQPGVE